MHSEALQNARVELMCSLSLLHSQRVCDGERIWHLCWSPNGSFLASCGEDKMIRIWQCLNIDAWGDLDLLSGDISTPITMMGAPSTSSQSASSKCSIRCLATLEDDAQTRTLRCCEWSPDGRMMASASFDGTVVVWESQNASMTHWDQIASLEGHENEVKSVAWSHDGKFLATCGRDKRVWIWEQIVNSHEFECVSMLEGHTQDVKFIQWHPHESVLFSASYDDTIRVWAAEDEGADEFYCIATLAGHTSTVWALAVDPTGRRLVTGSADASMILWESDGKAWRAVHSLRGAHGANPIYSLSWSAEHGHILSGAGDNHVAVCRASRDLGGVGEWTLGWLAACSQQAAHSGDVNCARWNPVPARAHLAASASDDGSIKFWRLDL